ncbi:50S ribosomal protein L25 [Clostridium amazonitimonense]|uniref:50S ribosomal protein L25 n=1 Tax=Clostridium amazonitimonense TaxID=1499689 RepID=UPI000509EFD4|nr:50S ribosomal protein L25 [Clostridium amazonitimonense]
MPVDNIQAFERSGNLKRLRAEGFVPGVIYGQDLEPKSIQFESSDISKLLKENTKTSRIKVNIGDKTKRCIVKSVQKDVLKGEILNIDLQAISENEEIKLKVPVTFTGRSMLENKNLLLENYLMEIELSGKVKDMPELIEIDVEKMKFGDKVMVSDLEFNDNLTVVSAPDEVIAVISSSKQQVMEEESEE